MYAMSSVNEGKYRVLSDSLNAAFRGAPRSMEPIQVGSKQVGSGADIALSIVQQEMVNGQPRALLAAVPLSKDDHEPMGNRVTGAGSAGQGGAGTGGGAGAGTGTGSAGAVMAAGGNGLTVPEQDQVIGAVEQAMGELILANVLAVRRKGSSVEVEIRTDVLFASGSASLTPRTSQIIERLAAVLGPLGHYVRVEGHTDNQPIRNSSYPSNWELSAGRAASVVHVLAEHGLDNSRLAIVGLGENHPVATNATAEGRNQNRRVVIVILGKGDGIPARVASAAAITNAGTPPSTAAGPAARAPAASTQRPVAAEPAASVTPVTIPR
jgi:chemotaxis protein MotB